MDFAFDVPKLDFTERALPSVYQLISTYNERLSDIIS